MHFANAHYAHANTLTAPGHATLFTGAHAAGHGLISNEWIDRESGDFVYCVEDTNHQLLGQKSTAHIGTSPRNLTTNTIGDELIVGSGNQSRVFSVSLKDRGAILPAGHLGKAFWYSDSSGHFVSSDFYYDSYPEWVQAFNQLGSLHDRTALWGQSRPSTSYHWEDNRRGERGAVSNVFPHTLADSISDSAFFAELPYTPYGDALVTDFARTLIEAEGLGTGDSPDMLCISLSATDKIGHAYGPQSWEAQDNLNQLDITIEQLLHVVDASVGLDQTLVLLTSVHGCAGNPEWQEDLGLPAGRVNIDSILTVTSAIVASRLACDQDIIAGFHNPSVFLDQGSIATCGLAAASVENELKDLIQDQNGIAFVVTRSELLTDRFPNSAFNDRVRHAFHPLRSGDLYIVQQPFWYLHSKHNEKAAMHGSPYNYDTHVPIIFSGPGIPSGCRVHRKVAPSDIAVTLALYLGVGIPAHSVGTPLFEVLLDKTEHTSTSEGASQDPPSSCCR